MNIIKNKNLRFIFKFLIILLFILFSIYNIKEINNDIIKNKNNNYDNINMIKVEIKGEVQKPNIYYFYSYNTLNDLIIKSGPTIFSDLSNLDLNEELVANKVYIIPKKELNIKLDYNNELININTASLEELIKLNGVGKLIAQRIIDYRLENNNFKNIEELKNVKGIGNEIFNKIKTRIKI